MAYDRSGSCLKANNSCHIVIGQNVHSNGVRAGQDPASTFSVHQTNDDAFIILWLGIIQNGYNNCLFGFAYKKIEQQNKKQ